MHQFEPRRVSPNRLAALSRCGIAFRLRYIEQLPPEVAGSAMLFGRVLHKALEAWSVERSRDLVELVEQAWPTCTEGTSVRSFLAAYKPLGVEATRLEQAIRDDWARKGKESKAPRMTTLFKTSDVAQRLNALLAEWLPRLEAGSPWRFSENDPLPALYDESLVLAERYQQRWRHLPPSLHTEFAFDVPFHGFTLNGYVDSIEPVVDRETGELKGLGIIDYKTYRREPAEQKDWRQLVVYDLAVRHLLDRGVLHLPPALVGAPLLVGIDYVRFADGERPRRFWQMGEADHARLARELDAYAVVVDNGAYQTADKNANPELCPYPSQCCLRSVAAAGGSAQPVEVEL